jgi:hypothetical protein
MHVCTASDGHPYSPWLAVSVFLFVIWLVSGAGGGLWFLWVVLPLGALLLGRWMMGAPARGDRRSDRPRRRHRYYDGD